MRLLITTQAIDRDDPVLGFFHRWVDVLATQFEHIDVICLRKGRYDLPRNVTVHSLGKETGAWRIKYIVRFIQHLKKLRGTYDVVFSHMNPHYIVLAGWYFKKSGIRVLFWRNHARMNMMTKIAARYAQQVFYTSPFACTRVFSHAVQMPVGIDTDFFYPRAGERQEDTVLFLGRLSRVKRPELFMETSVLVPEYTFVSYGDVQSEGKGYQSQLKTLSSGRVTFYPGVTNDATPEIYSRYGVYVNLTPEGSMDKTILEAAACGALILIANKSLEAYVPPLCMIRDLTPQGVADALRTLMKCSPEEKENIRKTLRKMVEEQHSLTLLVERIVYHCKHT